jgi:hypothetical protein
LRNSAGKINPDAKAFFFDCSTVGVYGVIFYYPGPIQYAFQTMGVIYSFFLESAKLNKKFFGFSLTYHQLFRILLLTKLKMTMQRYNPVE